jgi:hypothetical protein
VNGLEVTDNARVKIDQSEVLATGFRTSPAGSFPSEANRPNPGKGIEFDDNSSGAVYRTEVSGNFAAGISDRSEGDVRIDEVFLFDNRPDLDGIKNKDR